MRPPSSYRASERDRTMVPAQGPLDRRYSMSIGRPWFRAPWRAATTAGRSSGWIRSRSSWGVAASSGPKPNSLRVSADQTVVPSLNIDFIAAQLGDALDHREVHLALAQRGVA